MNKYLRSLTLTGVVVLTAGAASAATVSSPFASLNSTGTATFNLSDGLVISGTMTAQYRQPYPGYRPYVFHVEAGYGSVVLTPNVTIETPEFSVQPVWFLPPVTIPAQSGTIDLPIPVAAPGTLVDATHVSQPMPIGNVLAYDFGSFVFGESLSFGDLVQQQFETGATSVSLAGGIGPFGGTFDYDGALSGDTITADYTLSLTAGELLAGLESFALDLINENSEDLFDLAVTAFLDEYGICGTPLVGGLACDFFAENNLFSMTVNSAGSLTADYYVSKSITVAPIPLPAALPLLAGGLGLLGLFGARRKRQAAA